MTQAHGFQEERNTALTNLDVEWAKRRQPGAHPLVLLLSMHKARLECVDLAPDLRFESLEWLRTRGYKRMGGLPLPPQGTLPE